MKFDANPDEVVHVLLIEDDPDDAFLTKDNLSQITYPRYEVTWISNEKEGFDALCRGSFDAALLDNYVGAKTGIELVRDARKQGCVIPMILLTGVGSLDIDMSAMEAGASDYLEKGRLTPELLDRSIRYAINAGRARAEVAEKSAMLEMTLNSASAGIAFFDSEGNIATWNEEFLRLADIGLKPTDKGFANLAASRIGLDGDEYFTHFEMTRLNDGITEMRLEPTPNNGTIAIAIDISERKVFEDQLIEARDAAEQANQSKSEFIAATSHELRTPLNAIIGFSDIMAQELKGPLGNEDYIEYVCQIKQSGEHLLSLINGILDISRIEAGKWTMFEEDVDLNNCMSVAVNMLQQRAEETGVMLTYSCEPAAKYLYSDERAIRQILINLATNAVKFTPNGGAVALRSIMRPDGGITIEVEDNGIGIAKEDQQRVLEAFEQAEGSKNRRFEGIGLGLPIVKKLAGLHAGAVRIDSVVGEGTIVRAVFPPNRSAGDLDRPTQVAGAA